MGEKQLCEYCGKKERVEGFPVCQECYKRAKLWGSPAEKQKMYYYEQKQKMMNNPEYAEKVREKRNQYTQKYVGANREKWNKYQREYQKNRRAQFKLLQKEVQELKQQLAQIQG